MNGQNIKTLLPSALSDIRIPFGGGLLSVTNIEQVTQDYNIGSILINPTATIQGKYRCCGPDIFDIRAVLYGFPLDDDEKRILYLMELANGLTFYQNTNLIKPDSMTMLKVKRMIDTMLKSVELVLGAERQAAGATPS